MAWPARRSASPARRSVDPARQSVVPARLLVGPARQSARPARLHTDSQWWIPCLVKRRTPWLSAPYTVQQNLYFRVYRKVTHYLLCGSMTFSLSCFFRHQSFNLFLAECSLDFSFLSHNLSLLKIPSFLMFSVYSRFVRIVCTRYTSWRGKIGGL